MVISSNAGSAKRTVDAILKLEELTDANAAHLLLELGNKSMVVVYSSKESSPTQTAQLDLIARDSNNYVGAIKFYRLDQAKYPKTWSDISHNEVWRRGPIFMLVNNNPKMIGTVKDLKDGAEVTVHSISTDRLRAEITRFLKIRPLVYHVTVDEVDRLILKPGLPTFIMAYRNKGPQNMPTQFQRFAYESQLYAGRVNFVLIDLDQGDPSAQLGFTFPKQDDPYYVVYKPKDKVGLLINNPLLSETLMEDAIRSYFGPGHEPAKVIP
ncbi:hypothetical protein [Synechococcus sp. BO 8801]|uniref:hypothetical protein n=1 Tax=Synechococcus sp. BO 8801 TaxID=169670 RepID=UPI000B991518|nr:hypothetical protein [Synechococcus sp. BO 8801]